MCGGSGAKDTARIPLRRQIQAAAPIRREGRRRNPMNSLRPSLDRAVRAAALALCLSVLLPPSGAIASSHREAPLISDDPAADNTDTYFFRDPVDPSRLVMIGNWIPLEEPAGGPNFFHFAEGVRYEFNVDWDGDAIEDVVYRFTFTRNVRNPNTFLQNTGPV